MEIIPDDYFSLHYQGLSLRKSGKLQEALDSFDKALKVDENEVITFIDKGDTFNEMGNTEKAMECYDKALKHVKKSFYGD